MAGPQTSPRPKIPTLSKKQHILSSRQALGHTENPRSPTPSKKQHILSSWQALRHVDDPRPLARKRRSLHEILFLTILLMVDIDVEKHVASQAKATSCTDRLFGPGEMLTRREVPLPCITRRSLAVLSDGISLLLPIATFRSSETLPALVVFVATDLNLSIPIYNSLSHQYYRHISLHTPSNAFRFAANTSPQTRSSDTT
ncbi:uncharacterized protein F5Z01DRAFT_340627 [Emericellopsis atlantica]|uniref:Uncharacterized protein n=1 Tax=Emericellopsis atlantica TaxID=2614577 RepID=A0A9P7ZEV9_9HYPO|nr:uncharacterized protein F5Z01DRAFT_340627 [Emericellopsis atlantica]KAG9250809.1 hypothetical protein F5Z01DRAFT_340627 [Emericellopsis atlantica]